MTSKLHYHLMPMFNGLLLNGALKLISKNVKLPEPVKKKNDIKNPMHNYIKAAMILSAFEKVFTVNILNVLISQGAFKPDNKQVLCNAVTFILTKSKPADPADPIVPNTEDTKNIKKYIFISLVEEFEALEKKNKKKK